MGNTHKKNQQIQVSCHSLPIHHHRHHHITITLTPLREYAGAGENLQDQGKCNIIKQAINHHHRCHREHHACPTCVFGGGGTCSLGGAFGLAATLARCAALAFSCSSDSDTPPPDTCCCFALKPVTHVLRRPTLNAPVNPPPLPMQPFPLSA